MSNCDPKPLPDTTNLCYISRFQYVEEPMPHFCTILGPAGDGIRNSFCSAMSNAGEWGNPISVVSSCAYDSCIPYIDFGLGCCNGCCGIFGGGLECQRLAFTGDPVTCCFNDLACQGTGNDAPPACYSDKEKQRTCSDGLNGSPNYRSLTSVDCQDVLTQYC